MLAQVQHVPIICTNSISPLNMSCAQKRFPVSKNGLLKNNRNSLKLII